MFSSNQNACFCYLFGKSILLNFIRKEYSAVCEKGCEQNMNLHVMCDLLLLLGKVPTYSPTTICTSFFANCTNGMELIFNKQSSFWVRSWASNDGSVMMANYLSNGGDKWVLDAVGYPLLVSYEFSHSFVNLNEWYEVSGSNQHVMCSFNCHPEENFGRHPTRSPTSLPTSMPTLLPSPVPTESPTIAVTILLYNVNS